MRIASGLFLGPEPAEGWPSLKERLCDWWPAGDAERLAKVVFDRFDLERFNARSMPDPSPVSIDQLIAKGEDALATWRGE